VTISRIVEGIIGKVFRSVFKKLEILIMVMSEQDKEFWLGYNEFADDVEFRAFQAWAYNGSCIQQRMGLFEIPPAWWETLKPKIDRLKTYQQANRAEESN
jgi:hypothetical protein